MADLGTIVFTGALKQNLRALGPQVFTAISGYMKYQESKVQDYARTNAPWTDRTGNARNGLFARHENVGIGHDRIWVYHTMPYGIWLEVRFAGQYRIIVPTITHEGKRIMAGLHGMLGRLGRGGFGDLA